LEVPAKLESERPRTACPANQHATSLLFTKQTQFEYARVRRHQA
jgi:hypothetical protein